MQVKFPKPFKISIVKDTIIVLIGIIGLEHLIMSIGVGVITPNTFLGVTTSQLNINGHVGILTRRKENETI